MNVTVARWGNSLAVRIPKSLGDRLRITPGTELEASEQDGKLVLVPARKRYTIEELCAGTTPEEYRAAFDWGRDMGREVIED